MIAMWMMLVALDGTGPDAGLQVVSTISDLGPTGILILISLWFARWLPKYLERQQQREDERLKENQKREDERWEAFQQEMKAEREMCATQFNRLYDYMSNHHTQVMKAIGDQDK